MDFNIFMNDVVTKAREEITQAGYTELTSPEEVDQALTQEGTTLVMVNSVCGCAGGIAVQLLPMPFITINARTVW